VVAVVDNELTHDVQRSIFSFSKIHIIWHNRFKKFSVKSMEFSGLYMNGVHCLQVIDRNAVPQSGPSRGLDLDTGAARHNKLGEVPEAPMPHVYMRALKMINRNFHRRSSSGL
jgi:hypothetical protein